MKEIKDFKGFRHGPPEKRPAHWEDVFDYVSGSYDVIYATDDLISIRFTADTYGWGAAHAVQFYRVINLDLKTGRPVNLSRLFKPRSNYVQTLSAYCYDDLKKQINYVLEDNFEREIKNALQNWNVTEKGLLINFEECQVAGCAAHELEVVVPYIEIKEMLAPSSVISSITQAAQV
ncbi:hypothetical protein BH18ACI2_BH18ACI2_10210 [soil metagenome]